MIIVLLLFFKSICLYCQRLVLHVHDRWINPKNVRLLKEAAEAKGTKFQIEEYRQVKKSKKRRYASGSSASAHSFKSPLSNSLTDGDNCRFCANTPQGYCRHHFHLQELDVQKQQRQQKFWCPLSGVVAGSNRSTEYRQLRNIKRELKRSIQQRQQLKLTKTSTILYEHSPRSSTAPNSEYSAYFTNDSGYQSVSVNISASTFESEANSDLSRQSESESASSHDFVDVNLPTPSTSFVESTYNFETCCETPHRTPSPISNTASLNSYLSYEYLSTSYL